MAEDSIIQLFEIHEKGHLLVPTRHCHAIKWLKVIMEKYPDNYLDVYKYLFYMTCPDPINNPYFNLKDAIKEEKIIRDNEFVFSTEDDVIQNALIKCAELYETPTMKAHKGLKTMIENIANYMETTKITHGRDGNINSVLRAGKDLQELRVTYNQLTADLHKEQKENVKRGGGIIAYDQGADNTRDDD
jgi:hypothetical protein